MNRILAALIPVALVVGSGVACSGIPPLATVSMTGSPFTDPANALDARYQGGAQLLGTIAGPVIDHYSKDAVEHEALDTAKEVLAGKPTGSIAIIEIQKINQSLNTPAEDSVLDGSSYRIDTVTTGWTLQEAEQTRQQNLEMSQGAAIDQQNVTVMETETIYFRSSETQDSELGEPSTVERSNRPELTNTAAPSPNPAPNSHDSAARPASSQGTELMERAVTPPLPHDVGVTVVEPSRSAAPTPAPAATPSPSPHINMGHPNDGPGGSKEPANWAGPDHGSSGDIG